MSPTQTPTTDRPRALRATLVSFALIAALLSAACGPDDNVNDLTSIDATDTSLRLSQTDFERLSTLVNEPSSPTLDVETDDRTIVYVDGDEAIDRLVLAATASIDTFWRGAFERRGWRYRGPAQVALSAEPMNNAIFDSSANEIVYDRAFLSDMLETQGDFAVVTLLAHEWGHQIQWQRGETGGGLFIELGADTLAGAYARYAEETGLLELGDFSEAIDALMDAGDRFGTPFYAPGAHGSPAARADAFKIGYRQGADGCCDEL